MTIKISDIIFRQDLYPRFEPNQSIIQKYSNSIDYLPPILIDQHNILIDGFHRWKGFQLAGKEEIECEVIMVQSEKELKRLAYKYNSIHGLQLSNDEKRKYAIEMIDEMDSVELASILSVSDRTIRDWTKNKREELEKERNRLICEEYLRAWNTYESVSKLFDLSDSAIKKIVTNTKIAKSDDFKPFIYNIWNTQKGNDTEHFGSFPKIFMDNLLYFHTNPLDIIFDPFAGAGTTVDSCKDFFRRYYCSDRIVKPGREKDIREHDIVNGFPEDLQKPKMIFLDPPYWILANQEYSTDTTDLGNMSRDDFYKSMESIIKETISRKIEKIAYLIRPIWDFEHDSQIWVDPMFDLYSLVMQKYNIEARYVIPYSTEQYRATMVEKAKENKYCLILNRELTIFKLK